jgi:hypothetical protein
MAFTRNELSLMAYTGATVQPNHLYWYSNSAGDAVTGSGFFNPVADQLKPEDLIYDVEEAWFYRVVSITEGVVVVAAIAAPT